MPSPPVTPISPTSPGQLHPTLPKKPALEKPAVTNSQVSGRIQQIINDLGTLPKSDARILAIGKLNGAIMRLQTTVDGVHKGD